MHERETYYDRLLLVSVLVYLLLQIFRLLYERSLGVIETIQFTLNVRKLPEEGLFVSLHALQDSPEVHVSEGLIDHTYIELILHGLNANRGVLVNFILNSITHLPE